jgi:polyphosphate glucokinase
VRTRQFTPPSRRTRPFAARRPSGSRQRAWTLAVDIGGSGVKASVLDEAGLMQAERLRVPTPVGRHPRALLDAMAGLTRRLPDFDRISVGVPGAVGAGRVLTAPNLRHPAWLGFDLAAALADRFGKPARIENDVALQGLAAIQEEGIELVVTLGTGFGNALFLDGHLVPQFGLGHHVFRKGSTYDEQLNQAALDKVGKKKWNKRLELAVVSLARVSRYDRLFIGGGNAKHVGVALGPRTTIISNECGIRGGILLWRDQRVPRAS